MELLIRATPLRDLCAQPQTLLVRALPVPTSVQVSRMESRAFKINTWRAFDHTMLACRPLSPVLLFAVVPVALWFIVRPLLNPIPPLPGLYASVGFSIFAFLATLYLVPALGPSFIRAHLFGKDLLKTYDDPMSVIPRFNC
jgi:hypothetical protein